jgi:hypothetical protein
LYRITGGDFHGFESLGQQHVTGKDSIVKDQAINRATANIRLVGCGIASPASRVSCSRRSWHCTTSVGNG